MSKQLKIYSVWLSVLVIVTGVFVLSGWQLNITVFLRPLPGTAPMNPMTAVAFIFSGSALLLLILKPENKQLLRIAKVLAVLVSLIGALRLIAVFNFYDAGIDRLLFAGKMAVNLFANKPISMAPYSAIHFLFSGISLLWLSNKKIIIPQYFSLLTAFTALLSIIGYTYGVKIFYDVISYFPTAIHTIGCFLLFSIAILFFTCDKGFMVEITGPYEGGKAVRVLLLITVFLPIIMGLFHLYSERAGLLSTPFGNMLYETSIIIICVILIWKTVISINKSQRALIHEIGERKKIEEEIKKNNLFLETIFDNIPNMIFVKDGDDLRFAGMNKAGEKLLGLSRQQMIGKNDYDFFPKEQADFFAAKDREVFTQEGVIDIVEEKITTQQGERWLHTKKIPVAGSNGAPPYMVGISEDITEKKIAGDKLQLATQQVFDLYNNAPCGYHSLDAGGTFVDINDTELKWLGYQREEVVGKLRFPDLIPPENRSLFNQKFPEFIKAGFVKDLVFEMMRKDKTVFSVILNSSAIYDEQGNYLRNRSTVFDYTERKKAEELLKEFKHFFNNSNDLSCIANVQGYFEILNPNFEKLLGYSEKELLGNEMLYFVHPDDITATIQEIEKLKSGSSTINFVNRYRKKDGDYLWLDWNATPDPVTGKLYAIARDITERKILEDKLKQFNRELEQKVIERTEEFRQSQENYFTLMNSVDGIVWEADAKTFEFSFVSQQAERLLGYPVEQWTSQPSFWADHIYEHDRSPAINYCLQCTLEKKSHELEYRMVAADGQLIWLRDIVSVQLENNEPVKLRGVMIDITERKTDELLLKQLNDTLEKRADELQTSNTELERFAYVASHDLQEPLRMVSSFLGLLEKRMNGQLDESSKQYIDFAVDGADRMKMLIQALLQYSRVGTNKEIFSEIDLNEVMRYTTRLMKDDIKKSRAVITINSLPVITANKTLITQLFINLLGNALKYQGDKDPGIEIGYTEAAPDWVFYVKDNGIGIDPKFFDKIFIIFQRLHNKNEYSGTGIGLAICKKIIEIHNGKIWVKSEPGDGSTFYFSIPKSTA